MSRAPQPSTVPDGLTYLQVRLPGWLKNEVIAECERLACSLNAWLVESIQKQLRDGHGLPDPPPARVPLPSTDEQIRAWMRGERLLMPCGKQDTCAAYDGQTWTHDGMGFCRECGIRVV